MAWFIFTFVTLQMSGLMGDSWILLLASASNLFQHHMSCSLWKMPRYAHEGPRGKKANDVSRFVLVVCGCCNKWPQTWWLATIEVCSLTSLDARSLKFKCQRGHASSTDSGGRGGNHSFSLLASGSCRHSQAHSCVTSVSASNFTPASPLCVHLLKKFLLIYLFLCLSPAQRYRICLPSRRRGFGPWVKDHPLEEEIATHSSVSCLENSMGRGAWQAMVYGVSKESDMT